MSLNSIPSGERVHIAFFGLRNAGKSSLVNAVTGQELSVVSDVKGTTTDPVRKAMELLPLGPVVIIDTPGLDDEGELGLKRVEKTRQILGQTDIAVLVADARVPLSSAETDLLAQLEAKGIPCLLVRSKADLLDGPGDPDALLVSAVTGAGVAQLKERLGALAHREPKPRQIIADLVQPGDPVILVTPIDESAPKGRLILPQQLTLRELLDVHAVPILCQPEELPRTLAALGQRPRLVVTDSQAFGRVSRHVPEAVPLTSFSILMARYKGDLMSLVRGASELSRLQQGERVLICEGCTHHRQCNDIGTVKLPGWIRAFCQGEPEFIFTSGGDFPADLAGVRLIVHCGGCMLNEAAMRQRMEAAEAAGVPIVNYGVAIAHMNGILRRSLELFPEALTVLEKSES